MKAILPITNVAPLIPKNDVWMIWLTDSDHENEVSEFQIYDLSVKDSEDDFQLPFEHTKRYRTLNYIDSQLKIPYRDWGANCCGWEKVQLRDVFFLNLVCKKDLKIKKLLNNFLTNCQLSKNGEKIF